jgi:hypothetical protein
MKSTRSPFLLLAVCLLVLSANLPSAAQDVGGHDHAADLVSPYAGQEVREIRTLSTEDIRQLQNGEGWGLAKAAELNGVPGPAHLLEIADQGRIELSRGQLNQIRDLHREMKARAVPVGLRLIEEERELNRRFAAGGLTEEELLRLLTQIADTTAELRYVHLSTHLRTLPILTPHQVHTYNRIRGYSGGGNEAAEGTAQSPHSHQP